MASVKVKFRPSTQERKEGTIYYQVIHKRIVRQLATDYKIYEHEWNARKSMLPNADNTQRNHQLIELRKCIDQDIERLKRIILELDRKGLPYEAADVISEYRLRIQEYSLFNFMQSVISLLKQMGKTRTSETYIATLNSFKQYRNGEDIMFDSITSDEIQLYEAYMVKRGVCPNTTSFYMRILRAVYNRAVEKDITKQCYPFKHVYTGVSKTMKRAISINEIKRIKQLDLSLKPSMALARDIFLFSFYTRGMAFVDIAYLRKKNIQNGIITYRRHKTGQQLHIKVEKCTQGIINLYKDTGTDYVFPIIKTTGDEYRQYKNALRAVNGKLKDIGKMIGTPVKLTTYVSRHSWGSAARSNNIPISVISESMGHDNEQTTQIYLASLDTAAIDEANTKILKKLLSGMV